MLVLSRRPGQSILIGKDIEVVVLGSDGVQVRVGIRAPREVTVLRRELLKQVEEENRRASSGTMGISVESLGAAWGLHLVDMTVALEDLVALAERQGAAYAS